MTSPTQILISQSFRQTRFARLEAGQLQELHIDRAEHVSLVGNIYKAQVARVVPGMQAAFIYFGKSKNGFLRAIDVAGPQTNKRHSKTKIDISDLLHEGQQLFVQVTKDAYRDKGARLSTKLSLSSKYLVYLPDSKNPVARIGISSKIEGHKIRTRLLDGLKTLVDERKLTGHFIIRTQAEMATQQEMRAELEIVDSSWQQLNSKMQISTPGDLVYQAPSVVLQKVRDWADALDQEHAELVVEGRAIYHEVAVLVGKLSSNIAPKLKHHTEPRSLFELYDIEQQIELLLDQHVVLPGGGNLIIEETEALTSIDVNTGSNIDKIKANDLALQTNLLAANEITRQLRLRHIGGIVVVDFIGMSETADQEALFEAFSTLLRADALIYNVQAISALGLIEFTRQRIGSSLVQQLCEPCEVCRGSGMVKSDATLCYEIYRTVLQQHSQFQAQTYSVVSSQSVVDLLCDGQANNLKKLKKLIDRPISLMVDTQYPKGSFDLILA